MTEVITGSLRMLGDRILLRPLKWKPSELLEVVRHGRPVRGEIVAIGAGSNKKKYVNNREGQKIRFNYSKRWQPTELKPGDVVELGGLGTFDGAGYCFPEVVVNNETLLICQEADVAAVHD